MAPTRTSKEVKGDVPYDGKIIIYIIKADKTSYINYMKPLILLEELKTDYTISVIDTKTQWYYEVHPERYVPALKDWCDVTEKEVTVFESTACLQYLADRYDRGGIWNGRTPAEKAAVLSWTAYQTAGLGPTAKYWLYFLMGYPDRQNPESLPKTVKKLHQNCVRQWQIIERRLSLPRQDYIALPDRPSIADISYFPFTMPWMFEFLSVDIKEYPSIRCWGERMASRPAVKAVLDRGPTYGHSLEQD
ncbi:glutathione S-transferase [Xylaria bambusicola]|uniref:glutathione S-transferase n=1 Tax=Xylaria bambusicola TaxID=326684 RepID=UPI00200720CA|nr:glutathione S-transferase [Xylaria bambusicola]KAI0516993.1 glutathione S-transferase [Xylaria bambusicola]